MRRARTLRPGIVLLEVLVAMAILGTAGLAMLSLSMDAAGAVRRARDADSNSELASDFLSHVALWDQVDLDRHLGEHPQGEWRLDVERTSTALYQVTLRDSAGARVLMATTLYRPSAKTPPPTVTP